MPVTLTDNLDIAQVGESFANANESTYIVGNVPNGDLAGIRANVHSTTYPLPDFDNSLQKGGLMNWDPGDALPEEAQIKSTDVVVTPQGKTTRRLNRSAERPVANRFKDLESNIIPILMAKLYQGADKDLITFLLSSANYDQVTFGGTGLLDTFAEDQNPMFDIMKKAVNPLRKYARASDFLRMSMYLSEDVMDVFASHWNFQGAGAAVAGAGLSAGPGTQTADAISAVLRRNLRLDEVKVFGAVGDTAVKGATSAPAVQSTGLCWIGVTDARSGWDLTNINDESNISPDGALQFGWSRRPEVKRSFIASGSEVESFVGRCGYAIWRPQAKAWGKLFPVGEIIT